MELRKAMIMAIDLMAKFISVVLVLYEVQSKNMALYEAVTVPRNKPWQCGLRKLPNLGAAVGDRKRGRRLAQ